MCPNQALASTQTRVYTALRGLTMSSLQSRLRAERPGAKARAAQSPVTEHVALRYVFNFSTSTLLKDVHGLPHGGH